LDSAKPGHIELSDQSAAKKLMMVIKAKSVHVEFCMDYFCVHMIVGIAWYCMFELKIWQNA